MTVVNLKDFVFFQEGPGVRKSQYTTNGIKLLNVGNIQNGRIQLSNTNTYISEYEANGKYKHFLADEGDLIIASSGIKPDDFNKKVAFISKEHLPLCMNTSTIRFKSKDVKLLDLNYLKYFFMSNYFKNQVKFYVTGSAQLNFGPSHLNKMKLLLPTLTDQKLIVDHLEKIEQLKDKRELNIQRCDELVKSIFYDMFGDPIKNNKNWELEPLNKICDVRDGTHESPKYISEGYPLITSKNLTKGIIDFSEVNFISKVDFDNVSKRSKVDAGDILMPMIGTIGNPLIVSENLPKFAIKNVALIKFTKTSVSNIYIKQLLGGPYFNSITAGNNRGGTQKFISLGDIRNIFIPLPPKSLQDEFAKKVGVIEKLKEKQIKSKDEIDNLFNCLMQKYFTGE